MEFLLLGPLEVRSAGETRPLGGPRPRAILADLLLHAGTVVSVDGLIDDLWGAAPPPTADAVVQNAIHRLRKTLGRDVIETRAPGYALHAEPGAIDARRFERLVRDARPLPPSERSAALRDALALWRGPPFADLAYESFLQDEIARLDELRMTALEDRLEAEIELGRHDAVVADASALAAQHPARERLCRLLMLALNHAGRQQEALDAYEGTRRALDELWGLEPSPETRALHLMILKQDPAIAVAPELPNAVGVVRRPVALLIVELLLDEELELEVAGSALGEARSALSDVTARHGGTLSSESGVELVAAFGAAGAREDDVLRAARTAVELGEILRGRGLEARLAVGTGRLLVEEGHPVLVGALVGQTRRALHEAVGGEIVVTQPAARLAGEALELDLDGRLEGVRPGRLGPLVEPAPFVGRAAELAALRRAFDEVVATNTPRHVVVVGEAGIGKTRLVTEALDGIEAVVLEAACRPYGEGITFLPLRELAERAAMVDPDASTLGDLTSADAGFVAARELFEHFTGMGPVVAMLDDVHWAVPTLLDLVEYVVRAVRGPLLVVSIARPELLQDRPDWQARVLAVTALPRDDAAALVEGLREWSVVEPSVARAILEIGEGVPLFLEQLLAFAAETGDSEAMIPPTLDALLSGRIDALESGERSVLERAAIVGRSFSPETIMSLTPRRERSEVPGRIASLERRRLIRTRGDGHEFVHALVHDAAYEAIGRSERAAMHEALARWLHDQDQGDELVGTHLERAALDVGLERARSDLAREAAERLGRSGTRALRLGDNAGARNLLARAAKLLESSDPLRLEIECVLGQALKDFGANDEAVRILESIETVAGEAGDRRLELRASVELAWPRLLAGSLSAAAATDLFDSAAEYFDSVDDAYGLARAEFGQFLLLTDFSNRVDTAAERLARVDEAFARLGLPSRTALSAVTIARLGSTPVGEAIQLCDMHLTGGALGIREEAYVRLRVAELLALDGDVERGRAAAAQARVDLVDLGEETALATSAAVTFARIEALAGNWMEAEAILASALAFLGRLGSTQWRAWRAYVTALMAGVAVARDDLDAAWQLVEDARRLSVVDDVIAEVEWRRVAGRVLARMGRPRKARALAREAVSMIDQTDDLLTQGEARLDLAEVLVLVGRAVEAVEAVREGIARLERKAATLPAARARQRFERLLSETGQEGAASVAPSKA